MVRIPVLSGPAFPLPPHRIAKRCDQYQAVFRVFSSCVSLTPDSTVQSVCFTSKTLQSGFVCFIRFFVLKPIGNFTGDVFSVRHDLKFSNFLRAWNY